MGLPWSRDRPATPRTLTQWMDYVDHTLAELSTFNIGAGIGPWYDAVYDEDRFRFVSPFVPGWRRLDDGRIELRGRLQGVSNGADAPLRDGDVVMRIPYVGSPPCNENYQSVMTLSVPCSNRSPNVGVCRVDVKHETVFQRKPVMRRVVGDDGEPVVGPDGEAVEEPLLDGDGAPVMMVASMTEIIARTPGEAPMNGWIGFDGVVYDPMTYIDALPPVKPGESPLVESPGFVMVQRGRRDVTWHSPGVDYRDIY